MATSIVPGRSFITLCLYPHTFSGFTEISPKMTKSKNKTNEKKWRIFRLYSDETTIRTIAYRSFFFCKCKSQWNEKKDQQFLVSVILISFSFISFLHPVNFYAKTNNVCSRRISGRTKSPSKSISNCGFRLSMSTSRSAYQIYQSLWCSFYVTLTSRHCLIKTNYFPMWDIGSEAGAVLYI